MSSDVRYGACLPTFGNCADRYVLKGYGVDRSFEEMVLAASTVKDLDGVELVGNWHVNEDNFGYVSKVLNDYGLKVCMMVPDLWTQAKWGKGSFASKDRAVRRAAIAEAKKVMDMAAAVKCDKIDLWFGQDGFDYSFQADFQAEWDYLVEGVGECADYRLDVDICIEYKRREPRKNCFVDTVGKTLLLINEVDKSNVGALLDIGHALAADENVAYSIALLQQKSKKHLFYVHFNDNYRGWDDDMMVGSVHLVEYLELLYWLRKTGYDGWHTLDIFPFREDGVRAATESIEWSKGLYALLDKVGDEVIAKVIAQGDATKASELVRQMVL